MFSSEAWLANPSSGFYNGVATTSYRNEPAVVLTKEQDAPTSSKIMSMGGWIKRNKVGHYSNVFSGSLGGAGVPQAFLYIDNTNNRLEVLCYNGSAYVFRYMVSRKFRDVSAWYHLWLQIDSTEGNNATADRVKIYVNGVRETTYDDTPTHIADGTPDIRGFNEDGIKQYFGHTNASYGGHLYYSDWYFIDGLAVSPVDTVGEFKNGVFIPKAYTPTEFGNNGFHLKFDQTGVGTPSATTIGADSSIKANHFTSTEGTNVEAHDCNMPDSPENNFATWNSLRKSESASTFSEGNLKAVVPVSSANSICATMGVSSGKYYWEVQRVSERPTLGVGDEIDVADVSGFPTGGNEFGYFAGSGNKYPGDSSYGATYANGDIIGFALDMDAGTLVAYKNNASQGTLATGLTDTIFPFVYNGTASLTVIGNFGQDSSFAGTKTAQGNTDANGKGDFFYAPPSGFLALCTSNLPEPTISPNADTQADDYFNTVLWNGNNSTQSITGVGFQPDWLWIKNRTSGSFGHSLTDSSRGANQVLLSESTDDEFTNANNVNAFTSDGFNLGNTSYSGYSNQSGSSYVGWNWKANNGVTSNIAVDSVSSGVPSITSTVQANTTAGFSIVTYTGNGTGGATVGHSLGVKPDMVIAKNRDDSANWLVWHKDLSGEDYYLHLERTDSQAQNSAFWSAFSSTTFTLGNSNHINGSGDDIIAYCFSEIESYSRFGTYTGNGSNDGPMIFTSFRPAFVMIKRTNSTGSWYMHDKLRASEYNPQEEVLLADASNAVQFFGDKDFVSNGFKIRDTASGHNTSGGTYIYMAFAEAPFKYANAR